VSSQNYISSGPFQSQLLRDTAWLPLPWKEDMASLLWGYARLPFMLASGAGVLISGALFYFQKYVRL